MASKKQLSQGELRAEAGELISILTWPDHPRDSVERLVQESASIRKDTLEMLLQRVREQKISFNAKAVVSLLRQFLPIGTAPKPEFAAKYYRAVFDCALILAGEESAQACRELTLSLLSNEKGSDPDSARRVVSSSVFEMLVDSKGLLHGLDVLLSDPSLSDTLRETFNLWSIVIPALASKGLPKLGISEAAAEGFLRIVGRHQAPLSSALKLAMPHVTRVASSVPAEFRDSVHAGLTTTLSNPSNAANDAGLPSTASQKLVQEHARSTLIVDYLPEVAQLEREMKSMLGKLNRCVEDRLQNLSKTIKDSSAELSSLRKDLEENEGKITSFAFRERQLQEHVSKLEKFLSDKNIELVSVNEKLSQYLTSHDAMAGSLENRERDAMARAKREFAEAETSVLNDIKHYIDLLTRTPTVESAQLAASCFNRLVRFLHKQRYLTPHELARIENIGPGDVE